MFGRMNKMSGIISLIALVVSLIFFRSVALKLFGWEIVNEFEIAFWGALLVSANFSALGLIGFFYKRIFLLEKAIPKLIMTISIFIFFFSLDYWYYEKFYKPYSDTFLPLILAFLSIFIFYVIYDLFYRYYALISGDVYTSLGSSKVLFVLAFALIGITIILKISRSDIRVPEIVSNLRSGSTRGGSYEQITLHSKFDDPKNPWLSVELNPGRYRIEARGTIDIYKHAKDFQRPWYDRVPPSGTQINPVSGRFPFPGFTPCSLIARLRGSEETIEVGSRRGISLSDTTTIEFTMNDDVLEDNGGEGWTIIITPLRDETRREKNRYTKTLHSRFNDPNNPWLWVSLEPGRYKIKAHGLINVDSRLSNRPDLLVTPEGNQRFANAGVFPFPYLTPCSLVFRERDGSNDTAVKIGYQREITASNYLVAGFTMNDFQLEDNGGEGWTIEIIQIGEEKNNGFETEKEGKNRIHRFIVPSSEANGVNTTEEGKSLRLNKGDYIEVTATGTVDIGRGRVGPRGEESGYWDTSVDSPYTRNVGGLEMWIDDKRNRYFVGNYFTKKVEHSGIITFRVIESFHGYTDGNTGAFEVTVKKR